AGRGSPDPPDALGAGLLTPTPALGTGLLTPTPALGAGLLTPTPALGAGLLTPIPALGAGLLTPTSERPKVSLSLCGESGVSVSSLGVKFSEEPRFPLMVQRKSP
ncbi:MAG: hypothetical protein ACHRXM_33865, partial [Isosphaerales bacterium]